MDEGTRGLLSDGALALLAMAGLAESLRRRDRLDALRSPLAIVVGCLGSLAIEAVLLRYPERTRDIWSHRSVRLGSFLGLLAAGRDLVNRDVSWIAAACWWGLVAYLGLLVCVLAGVGNPVGRLGAK